jgi:hypothetical protein
MLQPLDQGEARLAPAYSFSSLSCVESPLVVPERSACGLAAPNAGGAGGRPAAARFRHRAGVARLPGRGPMGHGAAI